MCLLVDTKAERLSRLTWILLSLNGCTIFQMSYSHTLNPYQSNKTNKQKKKVRAQLMVKQLAWFIDQQETRCTPVELTSKRALLKRPETVSTLSFAVYFGDRSKWELSVFFCLSVQRVFTYTRGSLGGGLVELPAASSGIKDICLNHRRGQKHGKCILSARFPLIHGDRCEDSPVHGLLFWKEFCICIFGVKSVGCGCEFEIERLSSTMWKVIILLSSKHALL